MLDFVVNRHPELVDIIHNSTLYPVRFLRQDQAAAVLHHLVRTCPEEARIGLALGFRHRVLGLVPVAMAGGSGEDGNFLQAFAADPVQAVQDPVCLQAGFLFVVHVPEVTAAAELGHRALPVDPVGGFFQNFHGFRRCPGLLGFLNPDPDFLTPDGIGNKYGAALNMGNPLTLGGVVRDQGFIDLIFG